MAETGSRFRNWFARRFTARRDIQIVLDRRRGERRRRIDPVDEERRREDRRRPASSDLGEVTCFFGEGTQLKGELSFRGVIRLDGRLEGKCIRGEVLIIGEQGQVDAEIQVQVLQARGRIRGDVTATRWVELLESSHVTGTIRTHRLTIWTGAIFNGKCEMPSAQPRDAEADAVPTPSRSPDEMPSDKRAARPT